MPTKKTTPKKSPAKKAVKKTTKVAKKPEEKPVVKVVTKKKVATGGAKEYFYANGKRKTSVARVRLYPKGTGVLTVNNRAGSNYFPTDVQQQIIAAPLKITSNLGVFDIIVRITGGGPMSQTEAVRHGIAKALLEYDPSLRITLKHAGLLTRDSRIKERKKYGLKRARRAPQFSKR